MLALADSHHGASPVSGRGAREQDPAGPALRRAGGPVHASPHTTPAPSRGVQHPAATSPDQSPPPHSDHPSPPPPPPGPHHDALSPLAVPPSPHPPPPVTPLPPAPHRPRPRHPSPPSPPPCSASPPSHAPTTADDGHDGHDAPAAAATDIPLDADHRAPLRRRRARGRGLGDLRQRSLGTLRRGRQPAHLRRGRASNGRGGRRGQSPAHGGHAGRGPGRDRERARGRGAGGRANGGLRLRHPRRVRDLRWRRPVPSERDIRHQQGRAGRIDASAARRAPGVDGRPPVQESPRRARRSTTTNRGKTSTFGTFTSSRWTAKSNGSSTGRGTCRPPRPTKRSRGARRRAGSQ